MQASSDFWLHSLWEVYGEVIQQVAGPEAEGEVGNEPF